MPEALLLVLAFALALLGMAGLALSLDAHWEQVGGRGAPPVRLLRVLGYAALGGSLLACLGADHATMAALVWPMALAVAAACVAFTLAALPARRRGGKPR